ncbi:hypothetical protein Ahy_A07g035449 isoform A [Arachis hypogaea]|uniref:Uncharacterized protein n=1 Tax=Arachis hypogaea TaxID=3818 RepID=A0A445CE52_ARAHY|nr:hypothetical protein Ahy_A07g035449 isoform A [Arachis hypogaea]
MADGPKNLLLIAPQSASGVVLDAPEASRLLSAVAIAMSNSLRDYGGMLVSIVIIPVKFLLQLLGTFQAMQLLQLQLSSLHQSKWRRRSCFSCSCPQSKCWQGRDDFGIGAFSQNPALVLAPVVQVSIWRKSAWCCSKANARETKEELIDRGPKFLD